MMKHPRHGPSLRLAFSWLVGDVQFDTQPESGPLKACRSHKPLSPALRWTIAIQSYKLAVLGGKSVSGALEGCGDTKWDQPDQPGQPE
jgi:hypothetical protein